MRTLGIRTSIDHPEAPLIKDPRGFYGFGEGDCSAEASDGFHRYWCARPPGHSGRHAASTGRHFVAVWPREAK